MSWIETQERFSPPGKTAEYMKAIEKGMMPLAEKWGIKLDGCYLSIGGGCVIFA